MTERAHDRTGFRLLEKHRQVPLSNRLRLNPAWLNPPWVLRWGSGSAIQKLWTRKNLHQQIPSALSEMCVCVCVCVCERAYSMCGEVGSEKCMNCWQICKVWESGVWGRVCEGGCEREDVRGRMWEGGCEREGTWASSLSSQTGSDRDRASGESCWRTNVNMEG